MTIGELLENYKENENVEIWVINQHGCLWCDEPLTKKDIYEDDYYKNCRALSWEIDNEKKDKILLYITIST